MVLRRKTDRIPARAIRRCGELLKQFDGRGGDRSKSDGADSFAVDGRFDSVNRVGGVQRKTMAQAAQEAGLSERQQVTAVRVANVPTEQFETLLFQ
ncbi:MAG: hypothetical protein RJS97_02445 [Parvibaculaceae bacterium]